MEVYTPKWAAAAVIGVVASWFGRVWVFIVLTVAAILLDYVTGMLAGRAKDGLNSKKATQGLYKKTGIFMLMCLGLFLDSAINHFTAQGTAMLQIPFSMPIAHIVTMWIVMTEGISVCENLERLNVPIPGWLMKTLNHSKSKINRGESTDNR